MSPMNVLSSWSARFSTAKVSSSTSLDAWCRAAISRLTAACSSGCRWRNPNSSSSFLSACTPKRAAKGAYTSKASRARMKASRASRAHAGFKAARLAASESASECTTSTKFTTRQSTAPRMTMFWRLVACSSFKRSMLLSDHSRSRECPCRSTIDAQFSTSSATSSPRAVLTAETDKRPCLTAPWRRAATVIFTSLVASAILFATLSATTISSWLKPANLSCSRAYPKVSLSDNSDKWRVTSLHWKSKRTSAGPISRDTCSVLMLARSMRVKDDARRRRSSLNNIPTLAGESLLADSPPK
mmetsp:Transcript_9796/g.19261  ORF Transcript_9796/g.19261 Transcript_9796/m.19261 type:complete len:300 (+) Transcript_9796:1310-2209(+)